MSSVKRRCAAAPSEAPREFVSDLMQSRTRIVKLSSEFTPLAIVGRVAGPPQSSSPEGSRCSREPLFSDFSILGTWHVRGVRRKCDGILEGY